MGIREHAARVLSGYYPASDFAMFKKEQVMDKLVWMNQSELKECARYIIRMKGDEQVLNYWVCYISAPKSSTLAGPGGKSSVNMCDVELAGPLPEIEEPKPIKHSADIKAIAEANYANVDRDGLIDMLIACGQSISNQSKVSKNQSETILKLHEQIKALEDERRILIDQLGKSETVAREVSDLEDKLKIVSKMTTKRGDIIDKIKGVLTDSGWIE